MFIRRFSSIVNRANFPTHKSLIVEQYGEPLEKLVLKTKSPEEILPKELGPQQVIIKHLAAAINPADVNMVQGVYGIRPKLPHIVGNECVARVETVGKDVSLIKPGDLVLPLSGESWQSYSVQNEAHVFKINNNIDVTTGAQVKSNICSAFRMLKDYGLNKGDTLIQNGANSAVGVFVIQLAKFFGFKSINIIRDRPDKDELVKDLRDFGGDIVLTESEVGNVEIMSPILKDMGKPKVFLNCVGGKNAINCQKTLESGGYSVTYGAMSKQPVSVTASSLIFKNHKYVGFWISRWYKERKREEIDEMFTEVTDIFVKEGLKTKPCQLIDFEDRHLAFNGQSNNTKFIFLINK